jgi:5-hydroxyisourate hydrolase
MGLSTHVLDTMHGTPAAGMQVELYELAANGAAQSMLNCRLNADGRHPGGPLIADNALRSGRYRLVFQVAAYFRGIGVTLPDPPFLDAVTLDFGIARTDQHYHVPLLVSPWSHSTYRGS